MNFNIDIARKLFAKFNTELAANKKAYDYYMGKTDAKKLYPINEHRSNLKVGLNYVGKFIGEHVSYGCGSKTSYASKKNDKKVIESIMKNVNIQNVLLDSDLMRDMLIFGKAYEIAYIKDNRLKFRITNPLNSIAYCNTEGTVEMFLYFYKKELDTNTYIDCYCSEGIYHFNESFTQIEPMTPLFFDGVVPVSVATLGGEPTIFELIKDLQDSYETVLSNYVNESSDLRNCYMVVTGVELDAEEALKMKKQAIIQIPEANGKAEFLMKNISPEFLQNLCDTLEDKIYQISSSINANEKLQSNLSGTALANRIISLRNKIQIEQQCLINAIRNRLKILFIYLEKAYNENFDIYDIDINMKINIPSDDTATADIISKLKDVLPYSTSLEQLSFISNGDTELKKKIEEMKLLNEAEFGALDGVVENELE